MKGQQAIFTQETQLQKTLYVWIKAALEDRHLYSWKDVFIANIYGLLTGTHWWLYLAFYIDWLTLIFEHPCEILSLIVQIYMMRENRWGNEIFKG